jgi:hypothetical protein
MFTRRLWWWGVGATLVPLAGTLACFLYSGRYSINPTLYEKVRCGMSEKEIEAIIGFPPGHYCKRGMGVPVIVESMGQYTDHVSCWVGSNDCWIGCWLDERGFVTGKYRAIIKWDSDEPTMNRLRAWLGL